jgi:hypothetical protein
MLQAMRKAGKQEGRMVALKRETLTERIIVTAIAIKHPDDTQFGVARSSLAAKRVIAV